MEPMARPDARRVVPHARRRLAVAVAAALAAGIVAVTTAGGAPAPTAPGHPPGAGAHVTAARTAGGAPPSAKPVVAVAADPATGGYWLTASDGGVFGFDAPFEGSAGALALNRPIVGFAPTATGAGYWLVASDGGVFAYGDARYQGSMGAAPLVKPVVGMAGDPATGGYWLVAADGGVFTFDAPFEGSAGALALRAPVVGMAATKDGGGYWLVAADGGVFAYGDARYQGSMGAAPLVKPVVGMAGDAATGGYWLVAADGGVFGFDAPFAGSVAALVLNRAVVGMAPTADGGGYWMAGADGGLYALGGATYQGSVAVPPLAGLTVVLDPGHDGGNGADPQVIDRPIDGGGFTEPCDTTGTTTDGGYPEHAFNFAVALAAQAALEAQGATVVLTRTTDTGVGPCVDQRAAIANDLGAAAAVSIHADGGPPGGRGFDVNAPVPVVSSISDNTAIVGPSTTLADDLRDAFASVTGEPPANYVGTDGIDFRADLGGLTLSTVPKVLIECANMRNAQDAALTESPQWQVLAGQGIARGVTAFLSAEERA